MSQKRTHEQMNGSNQKRCLVAGGAGFIGSHLAKRLKEEGHFVRVADWQENIYFKQSDYCSEYINLDLRWLENCVKACEGMDEVYNLAADMGGMGFIGTNNHATILYNNTMISYNLLEGARRAKTVKKFFYSSSACVYPEHSQLDPNNPGLRESDAWPAHPADAYGLEKLVSEECAKHYGEDFHIQVRIGRFHNIYGPQGTWKGGREKAPAAFMRKAITSTKDFEVWGDGKQTRSFCFVDDCVEAVLRLMKSDHKEPINIGSEEMVSMNQMADIVMEVANNKLPIRHITGPEGVRGRNSNNDIVRKVLKWEPSINLKQGLTKLHTWMRQEIEKEKAAGVDVSVYASSKTVVNRTPEQVGIKDN